MAQQMIQGRLGQVQGQRSKWAGSEGRSETPGAGAERQQPCCGEIGATQRAGPRLQASRQTLVALRPRFQLWGDQEAELRSRVSWVLGVESPNKHRFEGTQENKAADCFQVVVFDPRTSPSPSQGPLCQATSRLPELL